MGGIQLMEVNAHSLFSKWFSESGKLVTKLFDKIQEALQRDDVLFFILIDEVESVTSARKVRGRTSSASFWRCLRCLRALCVDLNRRMLCVLSMPS